MAEWYKVLTIGSAAVLIWQHVVWRLREREWRAERRDLLDRIQASSWESYASIARKQPERPTLGELVPFERDVEPGGPSNSLGQA